MFWGLIMESGKRYTQTVERAFHVSMACLEPNTADNENVSVMLAFDNREFILCNLNKHKAIQTQLDLNFQSGDRIAFMSSGKGRVHLTGYLLETDDDEDDMSGDDLVNESSILELDNSNSSKKSNSANGTGKRKKEPSVTKSESKKAKLEAENPAVKSSSDEDEEEDDDDDSLLGEESDDDMLEDEDDEDEDEDDEDEESDEDEDESDIMEELETSKSKALNMKKKDKQMNKLNESQQKKNKSPNEKQKNRSLIEKQQKNKTPNEKQQHQQQQKNRTPNEKQGGNTPQKTPGNQINGMPQQQQSGKKNKKGMDTPKGQKSPGGETPTKKVLEGGVVVEDLKVGSGPVAKPGRQVSVYYVGRLKSNNKEFDSAREGPGFKFRLGRGEVIKGWDIGLNGMKVGGKRKVVCPAALAYGNKGSPPTIPPNSTLVFDVELRAVN